MLYSEDAIRRCCTKWVFLKIPQKSDESTGVGVSFLINLQVSSMQLYGKRDSNKGVFL